MSVQSWLNRIWYDRAPPPWWLLPLSFIYGAAAGLRRYLYAKGLRVSTRMSSPVIVIGNLSVGGTGKTPLVCWMVERLTDLGFRPGVVTRGYGGSSGGARLIDTGDDPDTVGDESILLKHRTGAPVAIGRDRPAASQLLVNAGCNVIVSDDGLQHYALARDCEIVVIDGDRCFGNGRLLPAGPLRETQARLAAADAVVVNGGKTPLDGVFSMRLEPKGALSLVGSASKALDEFTGSSVHAIAGIGNPERFFNMLRAYGIEVLGHPLPDHSQLRAADISFADERPVLMTEKDAVKCAKIAGPHHWYVPVTARFDGAESNVLLDIVTQAIKKRASRA
ncbi:MAG TPA: tetraacyldisaccharide 4'-kinase [Steroidobacteraceae bacterium]|jgi:tetraacyldisaccharide 4'-kinase|nr:tetraacyldisaccharide 4'-kinase [Steroidobacteraceae bacterium]